MVVRDFFSPSTVAFPSRNCFKKKIDVDTDDTLCYNSCVPKGQQKIASGTLFSVRSAARVVGLSAEHMRRLCRDEKVDHVKRLGRFFFTPKQMDQFFTIVKRAR